MAEGGVGRLTGEHIEERTPTGDQHPLHTDTEYARDDDLYGERITHGMLVLSVATGLTPFMPGAATRAFYGMDWVRFVSPTKIGDTLHAETEVVDKRPCDGRSGVVTSELVVKNQRNEDVLVSTMKALVAYKKAS